MQGNWNSHPYPHYEGSKAYQDVSKAILDLEKEQVLNIFTDRRYIIGHVCQVLHNRKIVQLSKGIRKTIWKQQKKVTKDGSK
jgi:hypothetical protein